MTTLPREDYEGDILPGSRWRQRGVSGHAQQMVTVLRVGTRSVLLVIEGGIPGGGKASHRAGKRYNILIDVFKANHILVSQPPGAANGTKPSSVVDQYFQAREVVTETVQQLTGGDVRRISREPVYGRFEDIFPEQVQPEETATMIPPKPPEPITPDDAPIVLSAQQVEALGGVAPPEGEVPQETPEEDDRDPLEVFLTTGRAQVERLGVRLHRAVIERNEAQLLLRDMEKNVTTIKAQLDRIEGAVRAAEGALDQSVKPLEHWPALASEMPARADQPPAPREAPVVAATAGVLAPDPHDARVSRRAWVVNQVRKQRAVGVSPLAALFVATYGGSQEAAIKTVSSILSNRMKNDGDVERISQGRYRWVG